MRASALGLALTRRVAGPVMHRLARFAGGPPPGLRRGAGHQPGDVPVLAVVVVGTTSEAADGVVDAVAVAQKSAAAFTPVFLVDEPVLAPFRAAGYVVELVGPAGLEEAVREMRLTYACSGVVAVDGSGPASWRGLPDVLVGVCPAGPTTPTERLRSLLRRVEAGLSRAEVVRAGRAGRGGTARTRS